MENYEVTVQCWCQYSDYSASVATIVNSKRSAIQIVQTFEPQYADSGGELTDGQVGTTDYKHEAWVGTLPEAKNRQ